MPLSPNQEWISQNSEIKFPFYSGSSESVLPEDFITDLKFFYDRTTLESVYLRYLNFSGGNYTLQFCYVGGTEIAISGTVPQNYTGSKVYIFGSNQESVVVFSTGKSWYNNSWAESFPKIFSESQTTIENSLSTSGPRLIRRIIIDGQNENPLLWRKETTQALLGGTNIAINVLEDREYFGNSKIKEIVQISSTPDKSSSTNFKESNSGIKTINGIPPSNHNFRIGSVDCIKTIEAPLDNGIHVNSNCLPCCTCREYQITSNAITRRYNKLIELKNTLQEMINYSVENYQRVALNQESFIRPVAKIDAIRIYKNQIKLALQNVSSIPIYGHYGVTISAPGAIVSFYGTSGNSSYSSVHFPGKYNNKFKNNDTFDTPSGAFTGSVGLMRPGSFVDLIFSVQNVEDARDIDILFNLEANGEFGDPPMMGCKKFVSTLLSRPDPVNVPCPIGETVVSHRYIIEQQLAP